MRELLILVVVAVVTLGTTALARADGTVECTGRESVSRQGDWYLCREKGYGGTCWRFGVMIVPGGAVAYDGC